MPEKLLLVDAPNHAFRAYHAIQSDMRAPDGFPTRALYGFTRVLLSLVREHRPDYVALVFDVGRTFRNDLLPSYKGQRPDMPEDLRQQWGELGPLAKAFGFPVLAYPDTEADDVIGTLAVRFAREGLRVGIVSGDKDFCQIVDDHIYVLDLMKGVEIGPEGVRERWGVGPERIIDLLSLMGDAADNVPGVPGVGEKKAAQYLNRYGDLEAVLAHAGEIGGKTGQAIAESAEQVRLARRLVTLVTDLDLPVSLADLALRPRDDAELARRLTRYNFRTLMKDLGVDPAAAARGEDVAPAAASDAPEFPTVWGPGPLAALAERLRGAGRFVVDLEREDERPARLCLVWEERGPRGAAVPWDAAARAALGPVLADPAVGKVGWDTKALVKALGLRGLAGDPMLADYLLVPEAKRRFDDVHLRHLGGPPPAGRGARALAVARLEAHLAPQVARAGGERVYREIELPLVPVLAAMEAAGIGVDVPALERLSAELEGRLARFVEEIHAAAGESFNVNSTQQLAHLLFEKLQLKGGKKIKTGWSTDADTLDKLRDQHPLPGLVLAYRELHKLKNTYVDPLPRFVAADGRVHTTFDQAVAATGRLSSNDPNLQNIPVRTDEGRRIRHCFVARPGCRFVSCDYSQIELRVLAHFCEEGPLVESFLRGEDIHRRTASEIFGVAPALVSSEMRRAAKAINFGIVYGMGAFRLANDLRIPRAEAQSYIDGYFARYPQVRRYMEDACARARETGYAETLYGRRRPVSGLDAGNPMDRAAAERVAINSPIQGTAADIIKLAMLRVADAVADTGAVLLLQVHDELVLEVPEAEVEATRARVKAAMEGVATLRVPLVVDTGAAPTWAEAH